MGSSTIAKTKVKSARRRQPEQVKEKVLKAALSVFAARGFEGATLQQMVDKADVSLPLIVYHFKSKENLWQAVIENAVTQFDVLISAATANKPTGTATQQLRNVIDSVVRVSVKFPEFHRIMATEAYTMTPRLKWMGERFAKRHFTTIVDLITRAQAEGNVVMIEPSRLSYTIVGMATISSSAAEYHYLSGRDPLSPEEVEATIDAINTIVFIR